jgi:hypothetical protein
VTKHGPLSIEGAVKNGPVCILVIVFVQVYNVLKMCFIFIWPLKILFSYIVAVLNVTILYIIVEQGDQIGRIFASWVIVYVGQVFHKYKCNLIFGLFFHGESYVLFWTKIALGYILGDISRTRQVTLLGSRCGSVVVLINEKINYTKRSSNKIFLKYKQ